MIEKRLCQECNEELEFNNLGDLCNACLAGNEKSLY